MGDFATRVLDDLLNPESTVGAALLAAVFLAAASVVAVLLRRSSRRMEQHLTDVTALRFVTAFAQLLAYLVAFVLYAHIIPGLRQLGTALLAGVSVMSIVLGLAAQNTLGNLIAGFSLVLYRPFRVGDTIRLASPGGITTARVKLISLGFTVLVGDDESEVIVPNSVMMGTTVVRLQPPPGARAAAGRGHHP